MHPLRHSVRQSLLGKSALALAPLALFGAALAPAGPVFAQDTAASADARAAPDQFLTLYPGIYTPKEAPLVAAYLAQNRAISERGPIDVKALVAGTLPKDTPGLGPIIHATADWVRYNNAKYDPDSPLRNDPAYARSLGFVGVPAYPTFGAHDDSFMVPYPSGARDTLLVSELNHSVTSYRPIHAGDTLYLVANARDVLDLTPQAGSIYRNIVIQTKGSVYNQRAEKVSDVVFRVTENIKVYKDGLAPKKATFMDVWEAPHWLDRPAHYYTDADWKLIRSIWAKEKRRGATPLYWEDVAVGDQPAWTLDGPIDVSVSPIAPWGMGAGGSRTMKKEIMDPATFRTMIRGEKDGIWRLPERGQYVPRTPEVDATPDGPPAPNGVIDTTNIHKEGARRSPLVNYLGRDLAIRQIQNWMGDRGSFDTIKWSIMDPRGVWLAGKTVPADPLAEHWLDEVPFMKGKFVNTHGLTQDVAIVKSYVTGKYVKDGRSLADLVWWIETIDGNIFEEGKTTVQLPRRSATGLR